MSDYILNNPQPNSITFNAPQGKEVLRITANGAFIANGVEVDEASAAVIAALSGHIRSVVADKDAEIERLNSELDDVWDALAIQREDNASFGDAFKRMTSEIERLRAALKDILDHSLELYATGVARAALAEEKKDDR